jgi:hypothetical protein
MLAPVLDEAVAAEQVLESIVAHHGRGDQAAVQSEINVALGNLLRLAQSHDTVFASIREPFEDFEAAKSELTSKSVALAEKRCKCSRQPWKPPWNEVAALYFLTPAHCEFAHVHTCQVDTGPTFPCRGEKRCILSIISSVHGVGDMSRERSCRERLLQELELAERPREGDSMQMDVDQATDPAAMVELLVQEYHDRQAQKRALDGVHREKDHLEVQSRHREHRRLQQRRQTRHATRSLQPAAAVACRGRSQRRGSS